MSTTRLIPNVAVSLLTTELNTLANQVVVTSSVGGASGVFDNGLAGAAGDGSIVADLYLTAGTLSGAPTVGFGLSVWFLRSADGGTTFEGHLTGTQAGPPLNRAPDAVFNWNGQTSPNSPACIPDVPMPSGKFRALAWNNGGGVAMASSANVLAICPKPFTQG